MSTEIVVAFIAFLGVAISILSSVFISRKQTVLELQKMRTEIRQTYAGKLLERRLDIYPEMYRILSDFTKKIESGEFTKAALQQFKNEIDSWDSKHAILFSGPTNITAYRFRKELRRLTNLTDNEFNNGFESEDAISDFRHKIGNYELALKSDLGIYVVDSGDTSKRIESYKQLNIELGTYKK